MKKFKFKLEPLLRYREFQEGQQKLAVAAAHSAVRQCETAIEDLIQSGRTVEQRVEADMSQGIEAERLRWFNNYLQALRELRISEEARRERLLKELALQKTRLTEKMVSRKVVENLRERKKDAYYQQAMKMEQQALDDMVIIRGLGHKTT